MTSGCYNRAAIDASRIVWCRAISPEEDARVIRYYEGLAVLVGRGGVEHGPREDPSPFREASHPRMARHGGRRSGCSRGARRRLAEPPCPPRGQGSTARASARRSPAGPGGGGAERGPLCLRPPAVFRSRRRQRRSSRITRAGRARHHPAAPVGGRHRTPVRLGVHRAGQHGVDGDAASADLLGERLGQRDHPGLRHRVGDEAASQRDGTETPR